MIKILKFNALGGDMRKSAAQNSLRIRYCHEAMKTLRARSKPQRGMTLLEILVTLSIAGLLIAVAAPPLDRYLDAVAFRSKTEEIGRDIARMRITALVESRALLFPQTNDRSETAYDGLSEPLPPGWSIEGAPIVFFDSGACSGGALTVISAGGRRAELVFSPPFCRFESD